jgi:hypothetical protein
MISLIVPSLLVTLIGVCIGAYMRGYIRQPISLKSRKLWSYQKVLHVVKAEASLKKMVVTELENDAFFRVTGIHARGIRKQLLIRFNKADPEEWPWHALCDWQDRLKLERGKLVFLESRPTYVTALVLTIFAFFGIFLGVALLLYGGMLNETMKIGDRYAALMLGVSTMFGSVIWLICIPRPSIYKRLARALPRATKPDHSQQT